MDKPHNRPPKGKSELPQGGVAPQPQLHHVDVPGSQDETPLVLLLGGLGMVGLHLVQYLIEFRLARFIRAVVKRAPSLCYLSPERIALLNRAEVEVMQADLSLPLHVRRAFSPRGQQPNDMLFQAVVDCAAETACWLMQSCYERNILPLRQLCAREAMTVGCERYIEVSTAEVLS
jgi:nucleoside-diphosphate-sugar epimerase